MDFPGYVAPGITLDTAFAIDAGVLSIGGIAASNRIGPTRGGFSFDPGMKVREVEYDGKSSPTIGIHRITSWDSHLKGKILQASGASIIRYSPGASSDGSTTSDGSDGNTITSLAARQLFTATEYLADVYMSINRSTQKALRIYFPYAMVLQWSYAGQDNNEGEWDIDIVAVNDPSTPNDCPFKIQEETSP